MVIWSVLATNHEQTRYIPWCAWWSTCLRRTIGSHVRGGSLLLSSLGTNFARRRRALLSSQQPSHGHPSLDDIWGSHTVR